MQKIIKAIIPVLFLSACMSTKYQRRAGEEWQPLFNKKDLTGWDIKIAKHPLNDNFNTTFSVGEGLLKVDYTKYDSFKGEFGHIYFKQPFSFYKIRVVYRFTGSQLQGGPDYANLNSGVMLHSQSAASLGVDQTFPVSLELQLLASKPGLERTNGNLCTPGTEVRMRGEIIKTHCINSNSRQFDPAEWVTAEGVVFGDSVIHHIINGDTVLTYERPQIGGGFVNKNLNWKAGGFTPADSVFWVNKQNEPLYEGFIALQAESHPIEFKTVELLNLKGCMDKKALNYKSYYVKADNSTCRYR